MTKTWFCTIFKRENNEAIVVIPTEWEFTENDAKEYCLKNWLIGGEDFEKNYRVLIG